MTILYDVQQTDCRYMSTGDMLMEARFLGLGDKATINDLAKELQRRGLDDYSAGRAVRGASA